MKNIPWALVALLFLESSTAFPTLVSILTTRDVVSHYSAEWEIRHDRGTQRLEGERVDLYVMLHNEDELVELEQLQDSGELTLTVLEEEQVSQRDGIRNDISCYRTVRETYESMETLAKERPDLVTVETIGESYFKKQNVKEGYDIKVLVITARDSSVDEKVDMMVVGGHHSRELPPPEALMQWAEHLVASYGTDPDVTWILNRTRIHIVPIANPDGRQIVQDSPDWYYRKNAHPNECYEGPQGYGTDLNRNYPLFWGDAAGASDNDCASDYHGTAPLSEPESKAVYEYASGLFDQSIKKGTADEALAKWEDACPTTATGIFIDVHSYGDIIYFPWGYKDEAGPNHLPLLTMSAKLAHPGDYKLWGPEQDGYLYFVSGDATDSVYGIDCVFSVGYELGSEFYADCSELKSTIVPILKESLLYAAKCVGAPYLLPLGPDVLSINVDSTDPTNVALVAEVSDGVLIVDQANYQKESDRSQPIVEVRVFVDVHPEDSNAKSEGTVMEAQDGVFDAEDEVAVLSLDLSDLEGQHVLYFQAKDEDGYVGPVSAVFVELEAAVPNGTSDPSLLPPSEAPSAHTTSSASPSQSPSAGGYSFYCYDSFANGIPRDEDDCYAVDASICYAEFPWNECTYALATYEYYNIKSGGQRDKYGYVSILALTNCDEDSSSVYSPKGSCSSSSVVEGLEVALEGCSGFFGDSSQTLQLSEGGGHPKITNSNAMCTASFSIGDSPARRSDEASSKKVNDLLVLTLKPQFTLNFFDGHQEDDPPEASHILVLLERSDAYLRKILAGEYANLLKSIELDEIQQSYHVQPQHQFVLSFTAKVSLDASAVVLGHAIAELLSDNDNLREYVRDYARYTDSDGNQPNDLFHFTNSVHARIVGSDVAEESTFV